MFKASVVTCVELDVAVVAAGFNVLGALPLNLSVWPMARRSELKLLLAFNWATDTLCVWLIDQSVSPARTTCVLAAAASSAWAMMLTAAMAANEYMRPDLGDMGSLPSLQFQLTIIDR